MSEGASIIRVAAKGDGVTEDGRHVPFSLPGDVVGVDGELIRGPHHIDPACRHFRECGGCQLQHADDASLGQFVRDRVFNSAQGQGVDVGQELPVHLSPPHARRRATLHVLRNKGQLALGFKEAKSHRIIDLQECPVLAPELANLIDPIRTFLQTIKIKRSADIALTLCDQGVDCGFKQVELDGLEMIEAALDFSREQGLARLSVDAGYGPDVVWEPEPVTVNLSGIAVQFPSGSFLQATLDAENTMLQDAKDWLEGSGNVVDLFSGLGAFAFGLAKGRKTLAVEADQAAHLASKSAADRTGGRVFAIHRDLFRNPLDAKELNRFDAALLDPPRAGARQQIDQLTQSDLQRIVYISCNPSSWARDAAKLCEAGFKLAKLRPVGQFRWSTHVELVSLFER
ncbi:MAG: class I SAM-dependent RNA methyltransferase [Erythrobacter sp.]